MNPARIFEAALGDPSAIFERALKASGLFSATEGILQKWVAYARVPENELLSMASDFNGLKEYEVVRQLDNAIDHFKQAKSSLVHAILALRKISK